MWLLQLLRLLKLKSSLCWWWCSTLQLHEVGVRVSRAGEQDRALSLSVFSRAELLFKDVFTTSISRFEKYER